MEASDEVPTLCGHVHEKWLLQSPGAVLREYKHHVQSDPRMIKQSILNVGFDRSEGIERAVGGVIPLPDLIAQEDPRTFQWNVACARFGPRSLIGGMTALFHYHLIPQVPNQVWVVVPPEKKSTKSVPSPTLWRSVAISSTRILTMNLPLEHRRATNRGSSTLRMVSIILMATLWLPNLRSMTRATKLGDRHPAKTR